MWEELLAALLLEKAGFPAAKKYEETLNEYFMATPEDEFLWELEEHSRDLGQSLRMLRTKSYSKKFDEGKFAVLICENLEKIYDIMPLEKFADCAHALWVALPIGRSKPPLSDLGLIAQKPTKKNMAWADTIYREMFRYHARNFDSEPGKEIILDFLQYQAAEAGAVMPDFDRAEFLLGFKLGKGVRAFYSRAYALKVEGTLNIQKGFTIPVGNKRFDNWFSFNGIKGKTPFKLLPCRDFQSSARFIRDQFFKWTGGYDFGQRVMIGGLSSHIGDILILLNNQTEAVEWVDCGYGHYGKYEKNPGGVLAYSMEELLEKFASALL